MCLLCDCVRGWAIARVRIDRVQDWVRGSGGPRARYAYCSFYLNTLYLTYGYALVSGCAYCVIVCVVGLLRGDSSARAGTAVRLAAVLYFRVIFLT